MSQNTILELIGSTGTRPSITFFLHVIVFFSMCICYCNENNVNESISYFMKDR